MQSNCFSLSNKDLVTKRNGIQAGECLIIKGNKLKNPLRLMKRNMLPDLTFDCPFGSRQANLVLIAYASSEGSGEPAHPRSLARTVAARSYKP